VPAYNEEGAIAQVLEGVKNCHPNITEVIVVDDGSSDATAQVVADMESVKLTRLKRNFGYGAAIKSGMMEAIADVVCFFDAYGQHRVEDLVKIIDGMGSQSIFESISESSCCVLDIP